MLQKVVICGVDTSGLPLLSAKEQEELMLRLKAGDNAAREKFIVGNMRLVLSLVRRFWAKRANADDVFQAGCVGRDSATCPPRYLPPPKTRLYRNANDTAVFVNLLRPYRTPLRVR